MSTMSPNMPLCACGSKKFRPVEAGKSRTGKRIYTVACVECQKRKDVSKTVYALCKYLMTHEPTKAFLQLFEMES
ncbi:MAG: hypothetical protein KDB65_03975 [Calditrichaeota bacterium]|nr:hypothetical protein [Calditrichota bacterium]MCB9368820.1 hypothetical protein [Calditrichota bacterium]